MLKLIVKLPLMLVAWVGVIAVKLPTALSGLLVVPLLYKYRLTDYANLPSWTRPWANPEDWEGAVGSWGEESLPWWWIKREGGGTIGAYTGVGFKAWYMYHAIRNPANGLRSFEWLDLDIVPSKVQFIRSKNYSELRYDISRIRAAGHTTVWYVAWQGFRMGCEFVHMWNEDRHLDIKLGWRVEPSDATTSVDNLGTQDASFASKILVYRKG